MNKKAQKGFTLIELLLYTAISSVIISVSMSLLWLALNSKIKNSSVYEVNDNASQIIQYVTQAIQNSNSTNLTKGSNANTITLTNKDVAKSPTVISLSSGNINVTEAGGLVMQLNSSKIQITNLVFTNMGEATPAKDSIRISFTISTINNTNLNQYSFQNNFYATATLK